MMLSRVENVFSVILGWIKSRLRFGRNKVLTEEELKEQTVRRITLVLSLLKPVCGRPQAKLFKIKSNADIHRFMLLLCDAEHLKFRNVAGLMRCDVLLPHNAGTLSLREKKVDNSRTAAVLKLNIPSMLPQTEEIIFKSKTV